ncbi:radical SAM protein [Bilifractor porci]|jgi:MoaA/NifB/PqqE/SkfB family radical SAM enzyme|uniref:Radical SAM protein n=1 Tax=Bilifractor porci TaxID=2606636 RepID=A0A7X2P8P1_9FIRM|nr:radical SAM protein [Bilifractor porci]MST82262.1 radical SAM protein [Bilifractor porci]
MPNKIVHAAERKAFEIALDQVIKTANKEDGYLKIIDVASKFLGDTWRPEAFENLKNNFKPGMKWPNFFDRVLRDVDPEVVKGLFLSFGFETGYIGYHETQKNVKKYGINIPWVILFDPTSACNLHCTGCWASEYSRTLNLSYEDMDKIVTEGKALGTHGYVLTGGEPLIRKKDIVSLAKKHKDCGFMIFTNGTLVDQQFCDDMRECKNIVLSMSVEGLDDATDARRGKGVFAKIMSTMDLLRKNKLPYGTSICYTSANYKAVTSDEFLDFLIDKGVLFSWYFHFMPVGNDATMDLVPTPEQREYMYHRIREVRGYQGGKEIFLMDFQNDGEWVSGCIAGGKAYCHINPRGDVEPCVFIHYSSANIHDKSLLECLQQPLFKAYHQQQPFNENLLQPCPFLENPNKLRAMVEETGAKSTDMLDPESVEHLTDKVEDYAKNWAPVAEKLWSSNHPDYKAHTSSHAE